MTTRSYDGLSNNGVQNELPNELLYKSFLNLDLDELLTTQLVCMVWHQVSCIEQLWEQIAEKKEILLRRDVPLRATVLASFEPYCVVARLLFPQRSGPKHS